MVQNVLKFLITLSVVMFLLGLALGVYLGVRAGHSFTGPAAAAAAQTVTVLRV